MFLLELNLSNAKAIQLIKDFTSDHAWKSDEFYLDMMPISEEHYYCMVSHLQVAFQTSETLNMVVNSFYSCKQKAS